VVEVQVLDRGFQFEGHKYESLSAIASEVPAPLDGYAFFSLAGTQGKSA